MEDVQNKKSVKMKYLMGVKDRKKINNQNRIPAFSCVLCPNNK